MASKVVWIFLPALKNPLNLITEKVDSQKCILNLLLYVLYPPYSFPCNLTFVSRLPMSVSCLLQREWEAEAERSREGEGKNNRTAIEREEKWGEHRFNSIVIDGESCLLFSEAAQ